MRKYITTTTTAGHTGMTQVTRIFRQHARKKNWAQEGSNMVQPDGGISGEQGACMEEIIKNRRGR